MIDTNTKKANTTNTTDAPVILNPDELVEDLQDQWSLTPVILCAARSGSRFTAMFLNRTAKRDSVAARSITALHEPCYVMDLADDFRHVLLPEAGLIEVSWTAVPRYTRVRDIGNQDEPLPFIRLVRDPASCAVSISGRNFLHSGTPYGRFAARNLGWEARRLLRPPHNSTQTAVEYLLGWHDLIDAINADMPVLRVEDLPIEPTNNNHLDHYNRTAMEFAKPVAKDRYKTLRSLDLPAELLDRLEARAKQWGYSIG